MFTVSKVSAASREAKHETEEASKPGVQREKQDKQIEEDEDIDSAEDATVIFELSSSSEDE